MVPRDSDERTRYNKPRSTTKRKTIKKTLHAKLVREIFEDAIKNFLSEGNVKYPTLTKFLDATRSIVKKHLSERVSSKPSMCIDFTYIKDNRETGET